MISFTKTTPDKVAAIVAKLEARLASATQDLALARELYGSASLAVEEGAPNAIAARDKALKDIRKAESELSEVEATLVAARVRHADALHTQATEQAEVRWQQVKELAVQRFDLATQIEDDANRLAKNMEKLIRLGIEQFEAAPKKDVQFNSSSLSPTELVVALRQHLFKQGQTWAFKWPWGANEIPTFTSRVAEGSNWLLAQKARHENKPEAKNA